MIVIKHRYRERKKEKKNIEFIARDAFLESLSSGDAHCQKIGFLPNKQIVLTIVSFASVRRKII